MDFVAIDVETANADISSICQIGVVQFEGGLIARRWSTLVNPDDYFHSLNVALHGIDDARVVDAPRFADVLGDLHGFLTGSIVACHTPYDRSAIIAGHRKCRRELPNIVWLDTARVVRRTWLDRSRSGYGLKAVAEMLGIQFRHHDAEEDARVAGEILVRATQEVGHSIEEWLVRVTRPITSSSSGNSERITRVGNPEGPFFGEVAVFTGALSIPRREAADLAAAAGCVVASGVTKCTTLLIVGDQDVTKLGGHNKSSKHRKAEACVAKGQAIRILRESDFQSLIEDARRVGVEI